MSGEILLSKVFGDKFTVVEPADDLGPLDWAIDSLLLRQESPFVIELGVYRGKSITHISQRGRPDWTIYGFDSWQGNQEEWRKGYPATTFYTGEPPEVPENVQLVSGFFADTLPTFAKAQSGKHLDLIHVDCDLYSSTKTALKELSPMIGPGTIMVFDEMTNYPEWKKHEFLAFAEFVKSNADRLCVDSVKMVSGCQQVFVQLGAVTKANTSAVPVNNANNIDSHVNPINPNIPTHSSTESSHPASTSHSPDIPNSDGFDPVQVVGTTTNKSVDLVQSVDTSNDPPKTTIQLNPPVPDPDLDNVLLNLLS